MKFLRKNIFYNFFLTIFFILSFIFSNTNNVSAQATIINLNLKSQPTQSLIDTILNVILSKYFQNANLTNNTCTNNATNFPNCNACLTNYFFSNNQCVPLRQTCINGSTDYPTCSNSNNNASAQAQNNSWAGMLAQLLSGMGGGGGGNKSGGATNNSSGSNSSGQNSSGASKNNGGSNGGNRTNNSGNDRSGGRTKDAADGNLDKRDTTTQGGQPPEPTIAAPDGTILRKIPLDPPASSDPGIKTSGENDGAVPMPIADVIRLKKEYINYTNDSLKEAIARGDKVSADDYRKQIAVAQKELKEIESSPAVQVPQKQKVPLDKPVDEAGQVGEVDGSIEKKIRDYNAKLDDYNTRYGSLQEEAGALNAKFDKNKAAGILPSEDEKAKMADTLTKSQQLFLEKKALDEERAKLDAEAIKRGTTPEVNAGTQAGRGNRPDDATDKLAQDLADSGSSPQGLPARDGGLLNAHKPKFTCDEKDVCKPNEDYVVVTMTRAGKGQVNGAETEKILCNIKISPDCVKFLAMKKNSPELFEEKVFSKISQPKITFTDKVIESKDPKTNTITMKPDTKAPKDKLGSGQIDNMEFNKDLKVVPPNN